MKKQLFEKLKKELFARYQVFNREEMFVEITDDYFRVDWHIYFGKYINQNHVTWIINYCRKFFKINNVKGCFFVGSYTCNI